MIAWLLDHWLLAAILFCIAVGIGYFLYCAWLTGCSMFEEFFGPPA